MANGFAFEFMEPIWVTQHQINVLHAAIVLARVNDPLVVIDLLVLQSTTVLPLSTAGALQESETANLQLQQCIASWRTTLTRPSGTAAFLSTFLLFESEFDNTADSLSTSLETVSTFRSQLYVGRSLQS